MAIINLTSDNDLFIDSSNAGDTINGLAGNDQITAGSGNDIINGGPGNDILTGGLGMDILTGGSGTDIFSDTMAGLNGDHITDLQPGDHIQITDLTTANFGISGNALTYGNGDSVFIDNLGPGRLLFTAMQGGGYDIRLAQPAHNDFNGDGISDILWRSDSGAVQEWLGNANGSFTQNTGLGSVAVPTSQQIVGTGDFNGDGRVDVLWYSNTGTLSQWVSQANGTFTTATATYQLASSWHVAATGDFNDDGRSDVLWQNDSGNVMEWLGQANSTFAMNSAATRALPGSGWHASQTGDFNGDGTDDVFWVNDSGATMTWLSQPNGSFVTAAQKYQMPAGWECVGSGDFNGDGRMDVLWRNDSSGGTIEWLGQTNGSFAFNSAANSNLPSSWHVAQIGDFNGDGRDDILWRNDNGTATSWLGQADGSFHASGANYAMPTTWHVQDHVVF